MSTISTTIPDDLAAPTAAAVRWFSDANGVEFKATGIVEPSSRDALTLILCGEQDGQELCLKEKFSLTPGDGERYRVEHLAAEQPEIGSVAPELDPPAGERSGWLDEALQRHRFVLLLFYRGFW